MLSVTLTLSDRKGNRYGFKVYPIGTDFDAEAGVYVFTKRDGEHKHEILYVGETASFKERPLGWGHEKWEKATRAGITHVGVFPTPNRMYVQNRLIAKYNPPLNDKRTRRLL